MGYTCAPPLCHCAALSAIHCGIARCTPWLNYGNRTAKVQKIIDISTILKHFSVIFSAFFRYYIEKSYLCVRFVGLSYWRLLSEAGCSCRGTV